jgi:hypothetical protein
MDELETVLVQSEVKVNPHHVTHQPPSERNTFWSSDFRIHYQGFKERAVGCTTCCPRFALLGTGTFSPLSV